MPENPAGNVLKPVSGTQPSLESLSRVSARVDQEAATSMVLIQVLRNVNFILCNIYEQQWN